MKSSQVEIVEGFIEHLSERAHYGIKGEKPIAIIAALGYLCDKGLEGTRLLELLSLQHRSGVRTKFIQLASQYGRLKDPSASWSVITGGNRELQRAVEEYVNVDAVFAQLTKDQIHVLYNSWLEKLKQEAKAERMSQFPKISDTKRKRMKSETCADFVVLGSRDIHGPVEVWSEERLPFEPKGHLRQLRSDIRNAVKLLEDDSEHILHAVYMSMVEGRFDVENILFYNVGEGCFKQSARRGLRFERVFTHPPNPLGLLEKRLPHYQRYQIVPRKESFEYWSRVRLLARWNTVKCESLTNASSVWYKMMSGSRELVASPQQSPRRFGLNVFVHIQPWTVLNAASIVKPIFDGIVATFHQHDGTEEAEISRRLAEVLGAESGEIVTYLHDGTMAILGKRRLLWPWGNGIQWNPGDEGCVAGELLLVEDKNVATYELSGEIFEVKETSN